MISYNLRTLAGRKSAKFASAFVTLLCIVGLAACETTRETVSRHEDNLSAAGFIMRPANTPERQAMLNRLPPHRFVKRVNGDTVHYVYADPLVCDCLYVGSQKAYSNYQRYLEQKSLTDEQLTTAQMYSDPAWSWGAWGPWGPGYEFRFGPGFGW